MMQGANAGAGASVICGNSKKFSIVGAAKNPVRKFMYFTVKLTN